MKRVKFNDKKKVETKQILWVVLKDKEMTFYRCTYKKKIADNLRKHFIEAKMKLKALMAQENKDWTAYANILTELDTLFQFATLSVGPAEAKKFYEEQSKRIEGPMTSYIGAHIGLMRVEKQILEVVDFSGYVIHVGLNY